MDGREGGYIKLHRRVLGSPLWRSMSAEQRGVFVELLFLANWKAQQARWKEHWYEVGRGELSHSLATIAKEAATSVKVVRTALRALMSDDRPAGGNGPVITERYPIPGTGPGTGPRVLTVVNYCKYQDVPGDTGTGLGKGRARLGHGSGTGGAQREEGEEGEEVLPSAGAPPAAPAADPVPAPARTNGAAKAKPEKPPDPRHHPIRTMLAAVYAEQRGGQDLPWGGPHAGQLASLLRAAPTATLEEFERRWRYALGLRCYPGTADPLVFFKRWAELVPGTGPPNGVPQRRTMAAVGNWDDPNEAKAVPK